MIDISAKLHEDSEIFILILLTFLEVILGGFVLFIVVTVIIMAFYYCIRECYATYLYYKRIIEGWRVIISENNSNIELNNPV